jgi:hypothetical protein
MTTEQQLNISFGEIIAAAIASRLGSIDAGEVGSAIAAELTKPDPDDRSYGAKRSVLDTIIQTAVQRMASEIVNVLVHEHRAEMKRQIQEKVGDQLLNLVVARAEENVHSGRL